MMSVTGGASKELLRLGSHTVLARIIEEARNAGLDGGVIVSSWEKADIREEVGRLAQAEFGDFPLRIAHQEEPRGIGHAVWAAGVEDDALVFAGDVVFRGGSPCERMANLVFRGIDGCVAVEAVEESQVQTYGIVELDETTGTIKRILEKPRPEETPSRWAVASRWAFSKLAMALINDYCQNPARLEVPKEIFLTEIINLAIDHGLEFKAVALQDGQARVDCGSVEEYKAALRLSWD